MSDIITLPILLSLVFFTSFAIYLFMGIYIYFLNRHSAKNILFVLVCLALCVWTFSFSIANSAFDYETALLWKRVSAFGWAMMFALLVHFVLLLTENEGILRKKWVYLLLYLPALVNIGIFSLFSNLVPGIYNMANTSLGWNYVLSNSFGNWHLVIYCIGFSIGCIGLIVNWGKRTTDQKNKKVAYGLTISIVITVLIGTITDVVSSLLLSTPMPQLAPIIIIIPIAAMAYSIKHYDLMKPVLKSQSSVEGVILNEVSKLKLYNSLSILYILVALFSFVYAYFIRGNSLGLVALYSSGFFFCVVTIQFFYRLKIDIDQKDIILFLLFSLSIPYIILSFIEYASITVWAVPIIFLLTTIPFNNRRLIMMLIVAIVLTLSWIWIAAPVLAVQVSAGDHLGRFFIITIIILMCLNINQMFISRLKENEDKTMLQKLISEISADFVTVNQSNLDNKISNMLQLSGTYYQLDRACLLLFSKDQKTINHINVWCNDGINPYPRNLGAINIDTFPWWMNQILNRTEVHIPNIDILPLEASEEKKLMIQTQVQSLLSIPVRTNNAVVGFLDFEAIKNTKTWRDDHRQILEVLVNILADALTKVAAEKEINHMAFYDALTGLPNRLLFRDRLEEAIHFARRTNTLIGVFFIDLDSFKAVNDSFSHEAGDELLKQVAGRLSGCVRKHDTVARFGGDEFLIMLTNITRAEDISKIAEKVIKSFEQPIFIKETELSVTASAGIAIFPIDGEESGELIKNADIAMYSSKAQGKNKYTLFSPAMKDDVLKINKLINSLYGAQERNELVLYYQPQVSIATKLITGIEALIRWEHPDSGMILPETFIPLAEKTGLINSIGEWVLMTACRQNKAWQELGIPPIRMAVNLSMQQFHNPNLISIVSSALSESGLKPEYLELEITESVLVKEPDRIADTLNELKKLGLTIAIDDFGNEYSSLSRLKMLPIDRLKMDMQFIQGISTNYKDDAIAKIIIQLGRSLDLKVIAEGVETEQQLDYLTNQMCDEVQGYYYYKPMPAAEIEAILLKQIAFGQSSSP